MTSHEALLAWETLWKAFADTPNEAVKEVLAACDKVRAQAARIKVLEQALQFYADLDNYQHVQASLAGIGYKHGKIHDYDRGEVATKALRAAKTNAPGPVPPPRSRDKEVG